MVDMSLNIKNERTHALVRELATLQGVSQTEAVEGAVRAQLTALTVERGASARFERLMAISRESGKLVSESGGPLTANGLYDDLGLPL
jgi:antitoxin VapB